MRLPSVRAECCEDRHELVVSPEVICKLLPGILEEYRKLCRRHCQLVPKSTHINLLAQPKYTQLKFKRTCPCREPSLRGVEIVRMEQTPTRTEQLAFPSVSRLLSLKKHSSYPMFEPRRKASVNCLMRRSLHSMYSRLSNVQPPNAPKPRRIYTKQERAQLNHYFKRLSKPRKTLEPKEPERDEREVNMRRIRRLSKPKQYDDCSAPEWQLTSGLKTYEPTDRIKNMSLPKEYPPCDYEEAFRVKKKALKYRASERIMQLATPNTTVYKAVESENRFGISRNALRAKVSARVLQLAQPKDYMDMHTRENPYRVSRRALHAKASKRILELAQPHIYAPPIKA